MAISLKKIGAITVGGAMVASALAGGVMAATTSGDISGFMQNVVDNGEPNAYVVVGSNAAAMDVVSAADIAAKIGSMCYKDSSVTSGKAKILVEGEDETGATQYYMSTNTSNPMDMNYITMFAIPNDDYNNLQNISVGCSPCGTADLITDCTTCGGNELSTLMVVDDVDPDNLICGLDADGIEVLYANISNDNGCDQADVVKTGYASYVTQDQSGNVSGMYLAPAMFIPFLGEKYMVVDIDTDLDEVVLGKPIFVGNINEGKSRAFPGGYEVKVANMGISSDGNILVTLQLLKDGRVVEEKTDVVSAPCCSCPGETCNNQITLRDGNKFAVIAVNSYKNIAGTEGSVKVYAANNLKVLEFGEDYDNYFTIQPVTVSSNSSYDCSIEISNSNSVTEVPSTRMIGTNINYSYTKYQVGGNDLIGVALVRDEDVEDMSEDSSVSFLNKFYGIKAKDHVIYNQGSNNQYSKLDFYFFMNVKKELSLAVGSSDTVMDKTIKLNSIDATSTIVSEVRAPIAKLDDEVSLDGADKNLILVGGPVVNKLTKELADAGKVSIDNNSPATLQVLDGEANGNDVLVVAGGDREKTREAALELISNY